MTLIEESAITHSKLFRFQEIPIGIDNRAMYSLLNNTFILDLQCWRDDRKSEDRPDFYLEGSNTLVAMLKIPVPMGKPPFFGSDYDIMIDTSYGEHGQSLLEWFNKNHLFGLHAIYSDKGSYPKIKVYFDQSHGKYGTTKEGLTMIGEIGFLKDAVERIKAIRRKLGFENDPSEHPYSVYKDNQLICQEGGFFIKLAKTGKTSGFLNPNINFDERTLNSNSTRSIQNLEALIKLATTPQELVFIKKELIEAEGVIYRHLVKACELGVGISDEALNYSSQINELIYMFYRKTTSSHARNHSNEPEINGLFTEQFEFEKSRKKLAFARTIRSLAANPVAFAQVVSLNCGAFLPWTRYDTGNELSLHQLFGCYDRYNENAICDIVFSRTESGEGIEKAAISLQPSQDTIKPNNSGKGVVINIGALMENMPFVPENGIMNSEKYGFVEHSLYSIYAAGLFNEVLKKCSAKNLTFSKFISSFLFCMGVENPEIARSIVTSFSDIFHLESRGWGGILSDDFDRSPLDIGEITEKVEIMASKWNILLEANGIKKPNVYPYRMSQHRDGVIYYNPAEIKSNLDINSLFQNIALRYDIHVGNSKLTVEDFTTIVLESI